MQLKPMEINPEVSGCTVAGERKAEGQCSPGSCIADWFLFMLLHLPCRC